MKAVMYGAGNIGRGFIGMLLSESGYDVSFIDVNKEVIAAMNQEHRYPVNILYKNSSEEKWVENICCVDGSDENAVAEAIAEADIMATAVGVNILKFIAKPIAGGLRRRWEKDNKTPLNIIICENLIGADKVLKGMIADNLSESEKPLLDVLVGFVEASIGRMVPVQTPEMQRGNSLRVCVEAFDKLPLDKAAIKGDTPKIKNAIYYSPFEYYIERKLFIHNMGHATAAYLGSLLGYEYIWQAIEDPYIELFVTRAMTEAAIALAKRHKGDIAELYAHVADLINRFGNRQLGDTVKRVGGDIRRKLSPNDRLIGAYHMCIEQGVRPVFISAGIAAALSFSHDEITKTMAKEAILKEISHLENCESLVNLAEKLKEGNLREVHEILKQQEY